MNRKRKMVYSIRYLSGSWCRNVFRGPSTRQDPSGAPLVLTLPDLPLSWSLCGWASIGVLREILSDGDSLAWWAKLSRDDDRWRRVPLAPIFSISFWPRLLSVLLRRENVFSRFPFFLSSFGSSFSVSMNVLLLLPFKDGEEEATLLVENEPPGTSSARSCATLVWRTTSRALQVKQRLTRLKRGLKKKKRMEAIQNKSFSILGN